MYQVLQKDSLLTKPSCDQSINGRSNLLDLCDCVCMCVCVCVLYPPSPVAPEATCNYSLDG